MTEKKQTAQQFIDEVQTKLAKGWLVAGLGVSEGNAFIRLCPDLGPDDDFPARKRITGDTWEGAVSAAVIFTHNNDVNEWMQNALLF